MRLLSQRVLILMLSGMMFAAHSLQAAESYPVAIKNGVEAKSEESESNWPYLNALKLLQSVVKKHHKHQRGSSYSSLTVL